jgi:hypothetical protein
MASLEHDPESGRYLARFRFSGCEYKRSLKTDDRKEARALLGRIEYTVQLIERGELEIPKNADPATFIVTSGKRTGEEEGKAKPLTLKGLFETYQAKLPAGSKEESTLATERGHFKNLLRHLRGSSLAQRKQSLALVTLEFSVANHPRRMGSAPRVSFLGPDTP